jgi:hypothetical protein
MKLNTIDWDFDSATIIVLRKILKCKYLFELTLQRSSNKNFHFILLCNKNCEKCRKLYDDLVRYEKDKNRPDYAENVLFEKKRLFSIAIELLKDRLKRLFK